MNSIQNYIQNSIREISQFNMNDILVNVSDGKKIEIDLDSSLSSFKLDLTNELRGIVQAAENNFKESGILPLCISNGILKWELKNKTIETPLFLFPISYNKLKSIQKIECFVKEDEMIINPFLINYFHQNLEIDFPKFENSSTLFEQLSEWLTFNKISFELIEKQYLGNFHHHRFHLLKDLETLQSSDHFNVNINQILGEEEYKSIHILNHSSRLLFPSDNDHLQVLDTIKTENCVIQGPPGTGKSQVLSNIIGKSLENGDSTLVISEKRVALEVLEKKLNSVGLGAFLFVTTTETVVHDFLKSLEATWDKMEYFVSEKIHNLQLSEQYKDYLQLQLNLLSKSELVGGVTFDEFHQLSKSINFKNSNYVSDVPYINEWQKDQNIIAEVYQNQSQNLLQFIPFHFLKSTSFESLDRTIVEWKKSISTLKNQFDFDTIFELDKCIKKAAICQFILNESIKSYFPILMPNSTINKKYLSIRKRFLKAKIEVEKLNKEIENWIEFPSENETLVLLNMLEKGTFFKRRKATKRIQKLTKSNFVDPILALKNWKQYLDKKSLLSLLKHEFCEIDVNDAETDLTIIDLLLVQIKENEWSTFLQLSEEERIKYSAFHSELANIKSILNTYFNLNETDSIQSLFEQIETHFSSVIQSLKKIQELNEKSYRLLSKACDFETYEKIIFNSNWINFERYFPELAQFNSEQISLKLDQIIQAEEEENEFFSRQIIQNIYIRYQNFHRILQTTTARLNDEERELKKRLKKGKSILVKEFAKTRSHPSIRELLQTEAIEWIQLLKPIWLSNPVQVSNCFPMKNDLFELVIFDEASQIPLSNALGSIQRGKRIIIAGDEQQMSPSSFFKSGSNETIDLLHQAGFYWKKIPLKHHYRSQYPELIAFSNRYFYENSLVAYPSVIQNTQPISRHYCLDAIFENNQNEIEADKVVTILKRYIEKDNQKTIGLVAFSQAQLYCIWNKLNTEEQSKIQELIDSNTLFFKSLENVQGEECDHLIISLGYGKNSENEFHMRFGPINQKSGSKRLNVMFSRAKKSIDFVCSVTSSDFKLTTNESIRLLKLYLVQIENQENRANTIFPYNLHPKVEGETVTFKSIVKTIQDVNELVTMHRVLKNRGWNIKYS